ncbi:biotin--[acetyl-CoA-carboxylase] ligase [Herbiconiux ginsengi]|uniref:biotin--[biotin carboxyl-carrier protein] ligase n=1 Tax=Herbiconiux ginsengi TaxID=381665 RepID=A0A1H3SSM4_9MICO|nr:biotin--[acetyl-CoA-carboxylase] ligase [Herbiconiux ginsengi]SDZ40972.1 BirA family transcriptional regulator, biotin operon repressor / biotin-[acetyl-CoA-carboxylase] ligase [Herbiconiux ginsengi]
MEKPAPPPALPLSRAVAPRLEWMSQAGSTNDVLVMAATGPSAADWPDLAVIATDNQVHGRGRLGRVWTAPPGRTLAVSVLLRPRGASGDPVPLERYGMLPLLAGVAMARVVGGLVETARIHSAHRLAKVGVSLKWPNDVLIGERKVCGILGEMLPGGQGLVIGAGVNLTLSAEELPTPTSTSLLVAGVEHPSPDAVLAGYLRDLGTLYERWCAADGDGVASGLLDEVARVTGTLGRAVRVELPGGEFRTGVARGVDETGRLIVDDSDGGAPLVVSAGDVTHLRHDDQGNGETR